METTLFLAQLWSPALLAIGLGMLVSPSYYKRVYRDLEKETLALLTLSLVLIPVGVAHIVAHNVWDSLATSIISLLGWAVLLKGVVFAIVPRYVDQKGEWAVRTKLVPTIGIVLILFGAYLGFIGYGA